VFDLKTLERRFTRKHSILLKHGAYSPDGRFFVTTCANDQFTPCVAQVWNALTGVPVGRPILHKDGVLYASFSPAGREVVTAGEDFTALITDPYGTRQPIQLGHNHQVRSAVFSPSAAWVLTVGRDQLARVWEASSGEPITPSLPHLELLSQGVFIGNSAIAIAGLKKTSWIWRFPPAAHSLDDLVLLSRFLDGDLSDANAGAKPGAAPNAELLRVWQILKVRYPETFVVSRDEVTAWHEQQRKRAELEHNSEAAAFHAKRIEL
jgi:WD40 repeat protein